MAYLGDYVEDATINFSFHTTDTTGMPATLVSGAVSVYKGSGLTQSTAGVTLSTDHDGVTGFHMVTIDTSADAFYATANDYNCELSGGTVDGVSVVGAALDKFSIQNRYMRGTNSAATQASLDIVHSFVEGISLDYGTIGFTGNDTTHLNLTGLAFADDELNGKLIVIQDISGSTKYQTWITDWVNSTHLATVSPALPFTPENSIDPYWILSIPKFVDLVDAPNATAVTAIQNGLATPTNITAGTITTVSGNVNGSVGSVSGAVGSVTGAVGSVTGNVGGNVTGSVGSVLGEINATGGTIKTLDALDTAQDTQHGITLSKLLKYVQLLFRKDAAIATDNATELTAINADEGSGAGAASNQTDSLEANRDNIGTAGAGLTAADDAVISAIAGITGLPVIASGTIGAVGNDTTHLHLDGLTFANDDLNDLLIVVYDDSGSLYYSNWIDDWVLSTELATLANTLPITPEDSTDTYTVYAIRRDVSSGGGTSLSASTTVIRANSP